MMRVRGKLQEQRHSSVSESPETPKDKDTRCISSIKKPFRTDVTYLPSVSSCARRAWSLTFCRSICGQEIGVSVNQGVAMAYIWSSGTDSRESTSGVHEHAHVPQPDRQHCNPKVVSWVPFVSGAEKCGYSWLSTGGFVCCMIIQYSRFVLQETSGDQLRVE